MTEDKLIIFFIIVLAAVLLGILATGAGGMLERYTNIAAWFNGIHWKKINLILALIFSAFNLFFIGFLAVIIRRHIALISHEPAAAQAKEKAVLPKDEISQTWKNIRELGNSNNPSDWSIAILQADVLLSDVLRNLGYDGETMAEQLKIVDPTRMPSLERVWSAHRLRNMIAHDPTQELTRETVIQALKSFEQGLAELGMMEKET